MLKQEREVRKELMGKGANVRGGTHLFPGGECSFWPALVTALQFFRGFPDTLPKCGGASVKMVGQRAGGTQVRC